MPAEPQISRTSLTGSAELHRSQAATPPETVDPPLFRFDLRQLLWFVAALSGLMAALVSLPGLIAAALLLAVLVISAHLLSTAIGTRLRRKPTKRNDVKILVI